MDMSNSRELFENNKITESLCQFSFKQHLDPKFFATVVETLGIKYPVVQEIPLVHFNFNFQDQNPEKSQSNGFRLQNEKGDKVIQLFTDNISIHQIGNYQRWEVFREDIYFVIEILSKSIVGEIGRIDLRAINVFEFDEAFDANKYFNVTLNYPNSFVQHSNFHYTLEQVYSPSKCAGVIRGNYLKEKNGVKFVLDLSYVNWLLDEKLQSSDLDSIKPKLEDGHMRLYNLFVQAISDNTRAIIKKN